MNSDKVGFIGLGNMGSLMAKKLIEKAFLITVFDLRQEAMEEMVKLGAKAASSSLDVASQCDIIISVVRDIHETEEVLFGRNGLWEGLRAGGIVVLSSSLSPRYCRDLSLKAAGKGVQIVDAPVSAEARDFTPGKEWALLTLMIGGNEGAVARCRPVFEVIAKNIIYFGGPGAGMACKLINNLAMYGNGIVARECINIGLKAGLDIDKMGQAMSVSTGFSRALMGVIRGGFIPGNTPEQKAGGNQESSEDLGTKDKRLALELAEEVGANTAVARFMSELDLDAAYDAYTGAMQTGKRPGL